MLAVMVYCDIKIIVHLVIVVILGCELFVEGQSTTSLSFLLFARFRFFIILNVFFLKFINYPLIMFIFLFVIFEDTLPFAH